MERKLIESTLDQFDGHREKTAKALGIGVRTLSNKLRAYGYAPAHSKTFSKAALEDIETEDKKMQSEPEGVSSVRTRPCESGHGANAHPAKSPGTVLLRINRQKLPVESQGLPVIQHAANTDV